MIQFKNKDQNLTLDDLENMSFLEISEVDGGLELLVAAMECGDISHEKAMDTAMYGVSYITAKCREAGDLFFKRNIEEGVDARQASKEADEIFNLARAHANVTEKSLKHYPLAQGVFADMFYIIEHYRASTVIYPMVHSANRTCPSEQKTYFMFNSLTNLIKIGKSIDVQKRRELLQCGAGTKLKVLHIIDKNIESNLHKKFAEYRKHGEWFDDRDGVIAKYIRQEKSEVV